MQKTGKVDMFNTMKRLRREIMKFIPNLVGSNPNIFPLCSGVAWEADRPRLAQMRSQLARLRYCLSHLITLPGVKYWNLDGTLCPKQ